MGFQPDSLLPLKRQPKARKIVAFDVEGDGSAQGFILGAVVSERETAVYHDRAAMLRGLTARSYRGYWLWSHNLEYDLSVLCGGDFSMFAMLFLRSRILYAETQDAGGHKFRFCDSLNLFPNLTVADLGQMVGLPKLTPPEGLYANPKPGVDRNSDAPLSLSEVSDYCLRDAMVVWRAVAGLQADLNALGGQLQPTLSGCAMDLYRRRYQEHPWHTPHRALNRIARAAYYGGRAEPYRLGGQSAVNVYDANSLYPAAQRRVDLPDPKHTALDASPPSPYARLRYPGLSYCTLEIPDSAVVPIPVHVEGGLFFPTGRVTGCWTHNELRAALEHGVRLKQTRWSLYSPQAVHPFGAYVDDLYALKASCPPDQPGRRQTLKLLLNSLYGRWGVNLDGCLQTLVPIRDTADLAAYPGGELKLINDLPYVLRPVGQGSQPAYANSLWAACITAEARTWMLPYLTCAPDDLVYTDTDSVCSTAVLSIGSGLGELRLERAGVDMAVYAPKEYTVSLGAQLLEVACKGIPEALRLDYLRGHQVAFDSPIGIVEAAGRGGSPGVWIERVRKRQVKLPKRAPLGEASPPGESLPTRAWTTRELAELLPPSGFRAPTVPVCLGD